MLRPVGVLLGLDPCNVQRARYQTAKDLLMGIYVQTAEVIITLPYIKVNQLCEVHYNIQDKQGKLYINSSQLRYVILK